MVLKHLSRALVVLSIATGIAATAFASGETAPATQRDAARRDRQRSLFVDACTACHTIDRIRVQRYTKDQWRGVIAGMLSEGVPLTDEETELLVEYLAENFGPEQA